MVVEGSIVNYNRGSKAGYNLQSGEVLFFQMQPPFHLTGNVKYVCDFQVYWANGDITFEDVKGVKTPMYLLKKKQVEALYPITITEI